VLENGALREVIDLRAPHAFPAYRLELESTAHAADAVRACFPSAVPEHGAPLQFLVEPADTEDLTRRLGELLKRGVVLRAVSPLRLTLEERYRGTVRSARGGKGKRR
jgi:hypothetical protein